MSPFHELHNAQRWSIQNSNCRTDLLYSNKLLTFDIPIQFYLVRFLVTTATLSNGRYAVDFHSTFSIVAIRVRIQVQCTPHKSVIMTQLPNLSLKLIDKKIWVARALALVMAIGEWKWILLYALISIKKLSRRWNANAKLVDAENVGRYRTSSWISNQNQKWCYICETNIVHDRCDGSFFHWNLYLNLFVRLSSFVCNSQEKKSIFFSFSFQFPEKNPKRRIFL